MQVDKGLERQTLICRIICLATDSDKELMYKIGSVAMGNHLRGVTVLLLSWFVLTATHSRSQAASSAPSPRLGSDTASSSAAGGQLHATQIVMEAENLHPFTPGPLTT